jgi:PAS domain S-box-containing protein
MAVLQSLQDGVFVTASDGRIIDVNDAWPRLFGFTRDEVLGTVPPYAWWPDPEALPRQQTAFDGMIAIARGDVDSGEFEVSFRHKDGHFFRG